MPRIDGTTDSQSKFLRAFHDHPAGPPKDEWPHPAILRRWMRREGFRRALDSIKQTLRLKADLHLATTSSLAMHHLQSNLMDLTDSQALSDAKASVDTATRLLRLSQTRQRLLPPDLTDNDPNPPPRPDDFDDLHMDLINKLTEMYEAYNHILGVLQSAPPHTPAAQLMDRLDRHTSCPKHLRDRDPEKLKRIVAESRSLLRDLEHQTHDHDEPENSPDDLDDADDDTDNTAPA